MPLFSRKTKVLQIVLPLILILIFFSFTGGSFRRAAWYEEAFINVVTPIEWVFTGIGSAVSGVWRHYFASVDAAKENDELKKRVTELEAQVLRSKEIESENIRLAALLKYEKEHPQKNVVARVIASDPRAEFKSITINKGTQDGIKSLMPVVGPKGLVGKVGKAGLFTSRVILITDPNSAVDVFVSRSRARGMAVGSAWNTELKAGHYLTRLEYLKGSSDIREDDVVVTSGLDGVFPAGIPIGTVHNLNMSKYGIFKDGTVVPFEDLAELSEVMVILTGSG